MCSIKDSFNKEDLNLKRFLENKQTVNQKESVLDDSECYGMDLERYENNKKELQEALKREAILKLELKQKERRLQEFEMFFENFGEELGQLKQQNSGSISVIKAAMKFFMSNHEKFSENQEVNL